MRAQLNSKRQKNAPLQNDAEWPSFLSLEEHETTLFGPDESQVRVQDSQAVGSEFHPGGLQDSSDCIRPLIVEESRETRQGDENRHGRGRTSDILGEDESDRIAEISLHPNGRWKGKQRQPFPRDSRERTRESLGKEMYNMSLYHQLQEQSIEASAGDAHGLIEPRGIPLALRLQELVQQAQGPDSSAYLPQPQLRVQKRTGETSNSDVHAWARLQNNQLGVESGGISLALRLDELIQHAPVTTPSASVPRPQSRGKQRKQGERRHSMHRNKSASSLASRWSGIEDDIVENFDTQVKKSPSSSDTDGSETEDDIVENFDTPGKKAAGRTKNDRSAIEDDIFENDGSSVDLQTQPAIRSASPVPAIPTHLLWERFQEALESAPPLETVPTTTDHLDSNHAPSGFSDRLQNAVKKLKSQQMHFQKSLTLNESLHGAGLSRCLVVQISGTRLEAQLTTCQCTVLQSPPEWNDSSPATLAEVESLDVRPVVEVIFSSKMSGDLELETGRVIRVHPPWQEIHGAGKFGKIILGTYFCEMVD